MRVRLEPGTGSTEANPDSYRKSAVRPSAMGELQRVRTMPFTCVPFGKKHRTSLGTFELNLGYAANSAMRISLIVAPPCGSDSSQAPVQRSLILTL